MTEKAMRVAIAIATLVGTSVGGAFGAYFAMETKMFAIARAESEKVEVKLNGHIAVSDLQLESIHDRIGSVADMASEIYVKIYELDTKTEILLEECVRRGGCSKR